MTQSGKLRSGRERKRVSELLLPKEHELPITRQEAFALLAARMGIWVEGATETAAQISMVSSTQNSITVKVTAGSHGAPFGFDVVWRPVDQSYICAVSFFCDYTSL